MSGHADIFSNALVVTAPSIHLVLAAVHTPTNNDHRFAPDKEFL
jgi:hypothetical protein